MKKKLSRILGIGVTVALLASLVLVAAPVSALTQPSVTADSYDISDPDVQYAIIFTIAEDLPDVGGTGGAGKIVIEFPEGTDLTGVDANTDIGLAATSGIGSASFSGYDAGGIALSPDTTTGPTLTITLPNITELTNNKIGVGAMVQVLIDDVANPDTPGDYTLDVSTLENDDDEIEAAVTSASYEIEALEPGALPGIVQLFNAGGYFMGQDTGDGAITYIIGLAVEGSVIKIGPGTYTVDGTKDDFDTEDNDVTFVATGAAADTILKTYTSSTVNDYIDIDNDGITLEGFTIQGSVEVYGEQITITDCVFEKSADVDEYLLKYDASFTDADYDDTLDVTDCTFDTTNETADEDVAIATGSVGLTVSGCSFIVDDEDCAVGGDNDFTVEDSEFTGSSGIGVGVVGGAAVTVSGSTFDGLDNAFVINNGDVHIKDNTIINSTGDAVSRTFGMALTGAGGAIDIENVDGTNEVLIYNNTISDTDADEYALVVEDDAENVYMLFNNITGNEKNVDDNDTSTTNKVNATNNWWGDADGPVTDSISGDVDTSPVLGAPVVSALVEETTDGTLDAKTDVGVKVSGAPATNIIGAASYGSANPQESLSNASDFFDVFVEDPGTTGTITVKVYAGDEDAELHAWSGETDVWVEQDADFSAYGGYMYADVGYDLFGGTPFAVVMAPPSDLDSPVIQAPIIGAVDAALKPAFSWTYDDGNACEFELADNPNFVIPIVKLTGGGALVAPFYTPVTELAYDTTYFWRVKAIDIDDKLVISNTSAWVASVFTTEEAPAPPVEPEPDVWMCSEGLTFTSRATLESHLRTAAAHQPVEPPQLIIPAEAPITPGWIYVIIGIGAVLVIALIVLIVRTRRVA